MKKLSIIIVLICFVFFGLSFGQGLPEPDLTNMPENTAGKPTADPDAGGNIPDFNGGTQNQAITSTNTSTNTEANCNKQSCMKRDNTAKKCISAGIKLNTKVPIIGDCIKVGNEKGDINPTNAFAYLMGALIKIVSSTMLVIGFIMIIAAGVMISMQGYDSNMPKKGKEMILKVGAIIALLGLSGVILRFINPYFFS